MTPTNITYTATSEGGNYTTGRFKPSTSGYTALMNNIASWTENTMQQMSLNTYSSVWPPEDLRALHAGNPASPSPIITAWASFGWDSIRHRFVLWGGGHANTSANEPYVWDATTRRWRLAFFPAETHFIGGTVYDRTVDGNFTPVSSHTYHGNGYLPILNRFITFGGASNPGGLPPYFWQGNTILRQMGCYTLDLEFEGLGFLAGTPGTNPQRNTSVGVIKHGVNAWQPHDWFSRSSINANMNLGHINCGSAYAQENGHDVIYFMCGSTQNRELWRAEFVDKNPANDIVTQITTGAADNISALGSLSLDPVNRVALSVGCVFDGNGNISSQNWMMADLKNTPGTNADWQIITNPSGMTGAITDMNASVGSGLGLCYDTRRNKHMAYFPGAELYEITTPAGNPTPTTGWNVVKRTITSGSYMQFGTGGIFGGLWDYAPDLGCCVGVRDGNNGDVWIYKPVGWTDPRI